MAWNKVVLNPLIIKESLLVFIVSVFALYETKAIAAVYQCDDYVITENPKNYSGCVNIEKKQPYGEKISTPPSSVLPPHAIADDSSLAPKYGRRIQLNSTNPDLTKDECIALVNSYRHKAGKEGQVSVRKPSKVFKGSMTPWCVENFDGQGIVFFDHMF